MERDPVCRGEVDEGSAWHSSFQGRIYYFTSPECKADFDRDPARYIAAGDAETAYQTGSGSQPQGRMVSRARTKLRSIVSEQKDRAAESIGSVSSAFRTVSQRLREQNRETVAGYADKAAESVERFSGYLRQHDAEAIISEAENFVRQRPALVIGTALAAGFLAARFLKSSKSVPA